MRSIPKIRASRSVLPISVTSTLGDACNSALRDALVSREGDDAAITGQTRSLGRRLLGLNLGSLPVTSAMTRPVAPASTLKVA